MKDFQLFEFYISEIAVSKFYRNNLLQFNFQNLVRKQQSSEQS